jgi:hypothetical protein
VHRGPGLRTTARAAQRRNPSAVVTIAPAR